MAPRAFDSGATKRGGQALLASVVVIGMVGLLIAGSLLLMGMNSLQSAFTARQAATAAALNNACAEYTLDMLRVTPNFTGFGSFSL